MNYHEEKEAFEKHASKFFTTNEAFENDGKNYVYDEVKFMWDCWLAAKSQEQEKLKLLLCCEHLEKCESEKGVFNSKYQDEEPCLICLLDERKVKSQAVPEGFVLVKKVHPDAIVHNQGLGLFKECQIIYGWDGKSKDFKDALNKGFYHGVKLGAKAVLETAMIEAQEQSHE